ncbi:MAG: thiol-disulfide isomerase/thioredoxin [Rhodothermales bacterium]|jgi:thiol-disulfide isomerase/thioredoxin
MEETDKIVKPTQPWWKNGWVAGLLVLGLLHATGLAVHVQAGFQRVLLVTGLFNPDLVPEGQRLEADLRFSVVDAAGDVRTPGSSSGEVRFINFWATWCAPCLAEMPAIARLHDDYTDRVEFIMVSMDEELDLATRFLESKGYGLTPVRPASPIPQSLTTGLIPTTVVVDRNGRIAVHEAGMADYDSRSFRDVLDRLLDEPKPEIRQASLRR